MTVRAFVEGPWTAACHGTGNSSSAARRPCRTRRCRAHFALEFRGTPRDMAIARATDREGVRRFIGLFMPLTDSRDGGWDLPWPDWAPPAEEAK